MKSSRLHNPNEEASAFLLRPVVIERIAHWWKQSLDEAGHKGEVLKPPDLSEISAKFQCSEEEAVRGLSVGEHLYWGGGE